MALKDILKKIDEKVEWSAEKAAGEAVSRENEKEYCVWVKPTADGWNWLVEQAANHYMDILLPMEWGKRRFRIDKDGAKLTLKRKGEEGASIEENSDVGIESALTFYQDGNLTHLARRIQLPATDIDGAKHWDIDVFFITGSRPVINSAEELNTLWIGLKDSTNFADWVKVELEVERFTVDDFTKIIPFTFEDLIPGSPDKVDDAQYLRNYWDNELNL